MPDALTLPAFVAQWEKSTLTERSAAQQHFLDLCHLLGHPTPVLILNLMRSAPNPAP